MHTVIFVPIDLSTYPPIHLSIHPSIHLSDHLTYLFAPKLFFPADRNVTSVEDQKRQERKLARPDSSSKQGVRNTKGKTPCDIVRRIGFFKLRKLLAVRKNTPEARLLGNEPVRKDTVGLTCGRCLPPAHASTSALRAEKKPQRQSTLQHRPSDRLFELRKLLAVRKNTPEATLGNEPVRNDTVRLTCGRCLPPAHATASALKPERTTKAKHPATSSVGSVVWVAETIGGQKNTRG